MVIGVGQTGGDGNNKPIQPHKSIFRAGSRIGAEAANLVRGLVTDAFQSSPEKITQHNRGVAEQLARFTGDKDLKVRSGGFTQKLSEMMLKSTRSSFNTDA